MASRCRVANRRNPVNSGQRGDDGGGAGITSRGACSDIGERRAGGSQQHRTPECAFAEKGASRPSQLSHVWPDVITKPQPAAMLGSVFNLAANAANAAQRAAQNVASALDADDDELVGRERELSRAAVPASAERSRSAHAQDPQAGSIAGRQAG